MQGSTGSTTYERTRGLEVTNLTGRDRNHLNFDFNRLDDTNSSPELYLPHEIIQAQAGDILQINSQQIISGSAHVSIWIWINEWVEIGYISTDYVYYSFPQYTIDVDTSPGNYAIGFSVSWAGETKDSTAWRSWRQYSLHVWG